MEFFVMDDAMRHLFSMLHLSRQPMRHRRLESDNGSRDPHVNQFVVRPHLSLKARMLGGQAETIMRLGGLPR
jgi:hypothetical protein